MIYLILEKYNKQIFHNRKDAQQYLFDCISQFCSQDRMIMRYRHLPKEQFFHQDVSCIEEDFKEQVVSYLDQPMEYCRIDIGEFENLFSVEFSKTDNPRISTQYYENCKYQRLGELGVQFFSREIYEKLSAEIETADISNNLRRTYRYYIDHERLNGEMTLSDLHKSVKRFLQNEICFAIENFYRECDEECSLKYQKALDQILENIKESFPLDAVNAYYLGIDRIQFQLAGTDEMLYEMKRTVTIHYDVDWNDSFL